jgi:hypothetical protein
VNKDPKFRIFPVDESAASALTAQNDSVRGIEYFFSSIHFGNFAAVRAAVRGDLTLAHLDAQPSEALTKEEDRGRRLSQGGEAKATMTERFWRKAIEESQQMLKSEPRIRAARPGSDNVRLAMMREVLLQYLSPILLDSVLDRALHTRKLTPASVTDDDLAELASDIMVGLRLFVPEERLPQLMLALAEIIEEVR